MKGTNSRAASKSGTQDDAYKFAEEHVGHEPKVDFRDILGKLLLLYATRNCRLISLPSGPAECAKRFDEALAKSFGEDRGGVVNIGVEISPTMLAQAESHGIPSLRMQAGNLIDLLMTGEISEAVALAWLDFLGEAGFSALMAACNGVSRGLLAKEGTSSVVAFTFRDPRYDGPWLEEGISATLSLLGGPGRNAHPGDRLAAYCRHLLQAAGRGFVEARVLEHSVKRYLSVGKVWMNSFAIEITAKPGFTPAAILRPTDRFALGRIGDAFLPRAIRGPWTAERRQAEAARAGVETLAFGPVDAYAQAKHESARVPHPLDEVEDDVLRAMAAERSLQDIADEFGCGRGSVKTRLAAMGAKRPSRTEWAKRHQAQGRAERGAGLWDLIDDDAFMEIHALFPAQRIAASTGVCPKSVLNRAAALGLPTRGAGYWSKPGNAPPKEVRIEDWLPAVLAERVLEAA